MHASKNVPMLSAPSDNDQKDPKHRQWRSELQNPADSSFRGREPENRQWILRRFGQRNAICSELWFITESDELLRLSTGHLVKEYDITALFGNEFRLGSY